MQPLRCITVIENPGESTSAAAMREEVRASESEVIRENNCRKDRIAFRVL